MAAAAAAAAVVAAGAQVLLLGGLPVPGGRDHEVTNLSHARALAK